MAIENKNLFITKEEFKDSSFYDEDLFGDKNSPNEATNDKTIDLAIDMASNNIDYLSGFSITEKWPENPETEWTQNIKLATAHYVRYALTKGVDYIRGQQSLSISGISESINNPEDPYFIPPDVFNYLRKCKEYKSFKGYELAGVTPNRDKSLFSKFGSNCNEDSPWNRFLKIVNLLQGEGIIIKVTHPPNILGPVVTISFDKSLIPDVTGFETKEAHNTDINNLQIQINTKANKSDIPDISNLETKQDHKIDIDDLKNNKADKTELIKATTFSKANTGEGTEYEVSKIVLQTSYQPGWEETDDWMSTNKTIAKWFAKKSDLESKQNINDNNLTTTAKEIVPAINEINSKASTGWIPGQYLWMSTQVTTMPVGWKKVTITDGFTIVQGNNEGTTNGKVINHTHTLINSSGYRYYLYSTTPSHSIENTDHAYGNSGRSSLSTNNADTIWGASDNSGNVINSDVSPLGNLPAGIKSQLWIYDPNNEF